MARPRSPAPIDDRDEIDDLPEEEDPGLDLEPPPAKSSKLPWVLLIIVVIFSGAAGYLGYTTLMGQKEALLGVIKARDEAVANSQRLEAEVAGLKAARETQEKQVAELEAQLKEKDAKLAQLASEEEKGSATSKVSSKKGSKTSRKKKSSRR